MDLPQLKKNKNIRIKDKISFSLSHEAFRILSLILFVWCCVDALVVLFRRVTVWQRLHVSLLELKKEIILQVMLALQAQPVVSTLPQIIRFRFYFLLISVPSHLSPQLHLELRLVTFKCRFVFEQEYDVNTWRTFMALNKLLQYHFIWSMILNPYVAQPTKKRKWKKSHMWQRWLDLCGMHLSLGHLYKLKS